MSQVAAALINTYRYADESAAHAFGKIAKQGKSRLSSFDILQGLHNGYFVPRYRKALHTNNV
jgi:hypothetical protein